jgi:DNA polymerase-3 subunit delta'
MGATGKTMNRKQYSLSLNSFLGSARAVAILKRAIKQDRLPHAMIFSGPAGVGKCTLALLVAQYLNCLSPRQDGACGECAVCRRIMAVIESRHLKCLKLKDEGFCGSCANCLTRTKRHPDVRLIEPEKTTISIDQVRDMIDEVAFQPLEARYRVVILDPAEQMRAEAHNSLLKTLEEPASRTFIILVTTNPYMLLETIRSRCRMLQFGEIPQDQIERYLVETEGRSADEALLAAALSGGSLAAALNFNTEEHQDIRRQALQFVALLFKRGTFAEASAVAGKVGKDKQFFQSWVESVATLLQDIYYAGIDEERVGQRDLLANLQEISRGVPRSTLLLSIDAVKKLKGDLQFNVNRQLALEAMFVNLTRT